MLQYGHFRLYFFANCIGYTQVIRYSLLFYPMTTPPILHSILLSFLFFVLFLFFSIQAGCQGKDLGFIAWTLGVCTLEVCTLEVRTLEVIVLFPEGMF